MAVKNNTAKKTNTQHKSGFPWIIIICLIFCELLTYTWIRTESTHTILQISRSLDEYTQKASYTKALLLERERLNSDDRITRIARTRLHLTSDTIEQTVYLTPVPGEANN
jgi:hypothetical protein